MKLPLILDEIKALLMSKKQQMNTMLIISVAAEPAGRPHKRVRMEGKLINSTALWVYKRKTFISIYFDIRIF